MLSTKGMQGLRAVAESSARAESDRQLETDAATTERVGGMVRSDDARIAFAILAEVYRGELARRAATRTRRAGAR
jgi:hypothetical protein